MVSLMDKLSSDMWEEKGTNPSEDPPEGYQRYSINRRKISESAEGFQYSALDEEGKPLLLSITGIKGKKDPLDKMANVILKVDSDFVISGIVVDDDIFEKK